MTIPSVKFLKDYRPPLYGVEHVKLYVDLNEEACVVTSTLTMYRNFEEADASSALILDGREMELMSVMLDGKRLEDSGYRLNDDALMIPDVPDAFTLNITTRIRPQENTSLEGLYRSGGMFCTQCEAEGFRKITYFPDRPDVMATYQCTIEADKTRYPVLLSNGNPIDQGELPDGRHFVTWTDPFQKPSYLFALVAGDLVCMEDTFTTCSGRIIDLRIYVEAMNADKCAHAMRSLKKAMKWDEEVFGREYDLNIYMIVAVNDFNFGAMENKGLNIFNSKYILANPETATDTDYENIEAVIAHEYFHNWTGNRITLKNWFQLSLKEGLTVFRDHEFSADMSSRAVKRIANVRKLRLFQFPEDQGPLAHPVRPESYIEIDNFYTMTVYEKGAEVIRMLHTLLGKDGFRKGMDLYFKRHDGQAVTTEDFVKAMEDANDEDLTQFRLWYSQAGTPEIKIESAFDSASRTFSLTFHQAIAPTPDQPQKLPMHIPITMALLDQEGRELPLFIDEQEQTDRTTVVLSLKKAQETFHFYHVDQKPVPSILRDFSAPVTLKNGYTKNDLLFLFAHDIDAFNRWDAGQKLFGNLMVNLVRDYQKGVPFELDPRVMDAFRKTLCHETLDKALIAAALTLPSEIEIGNRMDRIDVDGIHHARQFVMYELARTLQKDFRRIYDTHREPEGYRIDPDSIARRSLKNLALAYLGRLEVQETIGIAFRQFSEADNMTDEIAALGVLSHMESEQRTIALEQFYEKWQSDPLVLDKWFAIQAASSRPDTLTVVKKLTRHPAFSIKNPNKVRALINTLGNANPWHFHAKDGSGYAFMADQVLTLNGLNPQIAARLAGAFNQWKKYDSHRQEQMKDQLERILRTPDLSREVYEIVSKTLA
jgi:aminopeptidase N